MTKSELTAEQVQELLEGATPGPWRSSRDDMDSFAPSEEGWMQHVVYVYRGPQVRRKKEGRMRWTTDQPRVGVFAGPLGNARVDAALIAAAPDLARLVIAQDEELRRLREALEWYADSMNHQGDLDCSSAVDWDSGHRARAALSPEAQP